MELNAVVLLVEDDPDLRRAMSFDFKRKGYSVLEAGSGEEAWRILRSETVHLVISDIRMPGGTGVELLNRIQETESRLPPVILVTGYTELNLGDARSWGAEAVFSKPIDRLALLAASDKAIGRCFSDVRSSED